VRDLSRMYDLMAQMTQLLRHATQDENAEVRETAEWALHQLNRLKGSPSLPSWYRGYAAFISQRADDIA
jgi:hypothetical protein